MKNETRRVACFCETTFDAVIPASADLKADPDVEQLILDGSFMSVTCPACSKKLSPEFPFHLTGVRDAGDVFLIPEADRGAYARNTLDYAIGAPGRIAIGFPELMEKVLIFSQGLDDRIIEIMKYYLLTGAAAPQGGESDVTVLYRGSEQGRLLFNIIGMKEGEIGVARLAEGLYAKIAADLTKRLQEDPFKDFCRPPWVSLRRLTEGQA
jgi:hypothetical protein